MEIKVAQNITNNIGNVIVLASFQSKQKLIDRTWKELIKSDNFTSIAFEHLKRNTIEINQNMNK